MARILRPFAGQLVFGVVDLVPSERAIILLLEGGAVEQVRAAIMKNLSDAQRTVAGGLEVLWQKNRVRRQVRYGVWIVVHAGRPRVESAEDRSARRAAARS